MPSLSRMALLFVIAVLSLSGTIVHSATNITNITICDAPQSNTTCEQGSCPKPPCNMLCGQTKKYNICQQRCDSSNCDVMDCDSSEMCRQSCSDGNCAFMECDAYKCFQICNRGNCGNMACAKNLRNVSFCEQNSGSGSGHLTCEADRCSQSCPGGNCTLICSSKVKDCTQACPGGTCTIKCEAEKCTLDCTGGGSCTVIKSSTTPVPTTVSSGSRLQLTASLGFGLLFTVAVFM